MTAVSYQMDDDLVTRILLLSLTFGFQEWRVNMLDITQRKTPDFSGVFRVADTLRYLYMVEVGGIEPPSEGTPSPALHA